MQKNYIWKSKIKIKSKICRICSLIILFALAMPVFADEIEYLDLATADTTDVCDHSKPNFVSAFLSRRARIIRSRMNESMVSDKLSADAFWKTMHTSLDDGTFTNRVAGIQTRDNKMGSDLFLSTIYASINQVPVTYRSVSPRGDSITLSGKMFIPKTKHVKNIIIASHYTICSNREAPSMASSIEGIFATKDYIVLMPDYIGYGVSDSLTHPYLHLKSTVSSAIDLLKAALPYLRANCYLFSDELILVGYSQGGAATLALQKTLEEEYADEFPILHVFAGAGPYDLTGTFDFYISNQKTDISCTLPMLVVGMDYGENLGLNREDFFQPYLEDNYSYLIESKWHFMNDVNTALGDDISELLKPIIFHPDTYPTSLLYEAVKRNCILHWTPKSPMYMLHSTEDNMVPFLNSEHIKAEFDKQGLDNIEYDFAPYGNHMHGAVTFFEKVYRML